MKIWFRINGLEFSSWTVVWKELSNAFIQEGIEVSIDIIHAPADIKNWIEMWWCDPQYWDWSGLPVKLRVGIALAEHHSILAQGRENVIKNINKCDILFCPSYHAMQTFLEAPIDIPMYLMPFGVNEKEFNYYNRDFAEREFRFLHFGVVQFRKGSWLACEAFIKAFKRNELVKLTIATHRTSVMFEQLKLEYKNYPQIQFVNSKVKSSVEYYKNHHVIVSPHLSEGFGLCILEAMATGMPCIVARCSSPREYSDKKYNWWIEMSELYVPVNQCLPNTAGVWRLPDVNSLAEQMRYTYEHREECQEKGKLASEYVLSKLTWRDSVKKAIPIIKGYL